MEGSQTFRFSLRGLAILFLGIAIGLVVGRVSSRLRPRTTPSEAYALDLSGYVIEPPDVLNVTVNAAPNSPVLSGDFLVGPDGKVNLGEFGQILLTGLSVLEARDKIAAAVQRSYPQATVTVEVASYNSRVYYLIHDINGAGNVLRLPFTGNENTLDALSHLGPDVNLSQSSIWISRPRSWVGEPQTLVIDFDAITDSADRTMNYQIFPGDRLFVTSKPPRAPWR